MKINMLPWPVLDAGFTNRTEPITSFGIDGTGVGPTMSALYADKEWDIAAVTEPNPDQYYLFGSGWPGLTEWILNNKSLLERLRPGNTYAEFPWPVLWTIRAVEAGKVRELRPEHARACAIALSSIPGINTTPGYLGAVKVSAAIADNGHITITVPDDMVGRWIGSNQANIRRMARAYGYPVTIVAESGRTKLTCEANVVVKIKKYFTAKKPSGSGKFDFGFVSRKGAEDVYIKKDVLEWTIKNRGEENLEGLELTVDILTEGGRSRIGFVHNEADEKKSVEAREQAAREEANRIRSEADKAELAGKMEGIKAFISSILPVKDRLEYLGASIFSISKQTEIAFNAQGGANINYKQWVAVRLGWAQEDLSFEFTRSGWEQVRLAERFYHKLNREQGTLAVKFIVEGKEYSAEYPATALAPEIDWDHHLVIQNITAETPIGQAVYQLGLYQNPDQGFAHGKASGPWGEYDITPLIAQLDRDALAKAGITEEHPEVTVEIGSYNVQFVATDDFYEPGEMPASWDHGGYRTSATKGGIVIQVKSPFVKWVIRSEYLDRTAVEAEARRILKMCVNEAQLANGVGEVYADRLLTHIMSQIPQFVEMTDLWIVDPELWNFKRKLEGIASGTVILPLPVKDGMPQSHGVTVIRAAKAKALGLPGTELPGPVTVYWPEGQVEFEETREIKYRFGEPPVSSGTIAVAHIRTEMRKWSQTEDRPVQIVTIKNVSASKIEKITKAGTLETEENNLGSVDMTYTLEDQGYRLHLPESLQGQMLDDYYIVEFIEPRRAGWYMQVVKRWTGHVGATMDLSINLGRSTSRDPSTVWLIDIDGDVVYSAAGEGLITIRDVCSTAMLVLKHQWSNYGYTYMEEWEVYHLPSNLTDAQVAAVQRIVDDLPAKYFTGPGTGWDLSKTGIRRFQTEYSRDFQGARREQFNAWISQFPVEPIKYRRRRAQPPAYEDPDHPLVLNIEVLPELKAG